MTPAATFNRLGRLMYGCYAWLILLLVGSLVMVACLLLPRAEGRRVVARFGAATVFRLIGSPVGVSGPPLLNSDTAVVVSNHQSYLDGMILTAVLPPQYSFLIKGEMMRVPIAGFMLSRLGSDFVDRTSERQRRRSARRLLQAAQHGGALAVFPEGTFDATPGLKPFHKGAFRAAWIAGLSIAPVVITGARSKLPSEVWCPRPGPLSVEFCPRIAACDHADEMSLMRATRAAILERLEEPDLDEPVPDATRPG